MKRNAAISLLLALSLLSGCTAGATEPSGIPHETLDPLRIEEEKFPAPGPAGPTESHTPQGAEEAGETSGNALAMALLRVECARKDGNVILSPLSIQTALAMASEGATGEAKEALEALGLSGGQGASLSQTAGDSVLAIANSMWFNEKLSGKVNQGFKNVLSSEYGAKEGYFTPKSLDSVREINGWVKEKTQEKIDTIITEDALSEDALAVLVNAIYFGGKWVEPFEDFQVREGKFHAGSGQETREQDAELMFSQEKTYFENELATGFSKRYESGYEFIGLLPKTAGSEGLEEVLNGLDLDEFLNSRTWEYDVGIAIPKFELEYANSLRQTLIKMGLGSLFEEHSLDAMLTDEALTLGDTAWVGDVLHKTYMKMYETGTEAAASTAIVVKYGTTSIARPREYREVILDRPFAFLIRDMESERIVFCGAVNSVE